MTVEASQILSRVSHQRPIVAIVGRPNVGKSTLFNRLLGTRRAIIDDRPGVTRDAIYAQVEWGQHRFTLVDTGGYVPRSNEAIAAAVCAQAERAIDEADVVVLLCDLTTGATDLDREVAQLLMRRDVPSVLVVNKVDRPQSGLEDFFGLGLGDPVPVSAASGRKSGDFLELLTARFEDHFVGAEVQAEEAIRVALVGRPNVGKSTMMNRLAGKRVSVVNEQPGTTRDTTNIRLEYDGQQFVFMDTAGLRRRSRVDDQIEYYSSLRAGHSIEEADVAVALIDGVEGVTLQDLRVINQVIEAGCGLVIAVNKWDLVDRAGPSSGEQFRGDLHAKYGYLKDYPLLFVSGLTGKRVMKCVDAVGQAFANFSSRVATASLNRLLSTVSSQAPPTQGGGEVRLFYATQHSVAPPTFVVFSNRPDLIKTSYRRFFERKLRDHFNFVGTPIRMIWRKRRSR